MSGSPSLEICQPQEADVIVVRDYHHAKWTTSNQIVYRVSNQLNDQQELVEKYKRRCVDLREMFEQDMKELREMFEQDMKEQEARFRKQEAKIRNKFEQTIEELEANLEKSHQVINNLQVELEVLRKEGIVNKNEFIDQKQKNVTNVKLFNECKCPHCNEKIFY